MTDPERPVPSSGADVVSEDPLPRPDAATMELPAGLNGALADPPVSNGAVVKNRVAPPRYNCLKCPGYCCSYPIITVTKRDLERLARWFGLAPDVAEARFTRSGYGHKRIMRRKADEHYGKICRFFDTEKRRCTVYAARPAVCREFPGPGRCGYYDFLSFERRAQGDPDFVASTDHA
jgi:Fe-S-cluster containining protein